MRTVRQGIQSPSGLGSG